MENNNVANLFDAMDTSESTVVVSDQKEAEREARKKEKRDAKKEQLKAAMQQTMQADPEFTNKLRTKSNSIRVVNSLGYGTSGNMIQVFDDNGKRNLEATSTIVGYVLENVGNEPLSYMTEEYAQDETGKFVGTQMTKQAAPGEQFVLARQYFTIFCSQPEISFTLANGIVKRAPFMQGGTLRAGLEAYSLSSNKQENLSINSDEVKKAIDEEVDGVRVIKPEYVSIFGYLNNKPESKAKKARAKKVGSGLTAQDFSANLIHRLVQEEGLV